MNEGNSRQEEAGTGGFKGDDDGTVNERPLSFAVLGHMESWARVHAVLNTWRGPDQRPLSEDEVQEWVSGLTPRPIFRMRVKSHPRPLEADGVYVETFIPPGDLTHGSVLKNIERVRAAADWVANENVGITSLGGFTSIVLEGNTSLLEQHSTHAFTTGNTLTAAYVVKGVEEACRLYEIPLLDSTMLIVGSTGDIGSACVQYFSGNVGTLALCARNAHRLNRQLKSLERNGISAFGSTSLEEVLRSADVIILVASAGENRLSLKGRKPGAIVCDAGYPKNLAEDLDEESSQRLFNGGLGYVLGGIEYAPDISDVFYEYAVPGVAHGCALEAGLLALEGRFESYSTGRGRISVASLEEIWALAQEHGFVLAPFHNAAGMWERQTAEFEAYRP